MRHSICNYLSKTNVQLTATYPVSQTSTQLYNAGYAAAAKFINASVDEVCKSNIMSVLSYWRREQISIGISSTQLLHNLSTAFDFQSGDEIIISNLNHEANSAAWARIAQRLNLTLKVWSGKGTNPDCDLDSLRPLLSDNTRIVACPHSSNITGTITRVKEIADLVHSFPKVGLRLFYRLPLTRHTLLGLTMRRRRCPSSSSTGRRENPRCRLLC